MSHHPATYVNHCSRCGNGLLRLYRCTNCGGVAAICDECELLWIKIAEVSSHPECASDGAFPACPKCGVLHATWARLGAEAIRREGWDRYLAEA